MKLVFNPFTGSFDYVVLPATGWATYRDTQYTEASPFVLSSNTLTRIPNNAQDNIDDFLPPGVDSLYDGVKVTPQKVGDYYVMTLRFFASSSLGSFVNFEIAVYIGAPELIFRQVFTFRRGAGVFQPYSVPIPFYSLDTFVANGGEALITTSAGTTEIHSVEFQVARVHGS